MHRTLQTHADKVFVIMHNYPNTVGRRFTNAPVHEQFGSRTNFPSKKTSRMTNGFSDYEHASWKQRQAESISAVVSVAG
jgi:hypothetical protein